MRIVIIVTIIIVIIIRGHLTSLIIISQAENKSEIIMESETAAKHRGDHNTTDITDGVSYFHSGKRTDFFIKEINTEVGVNWNCVIRAIKEIF